MSIVTKKGDTGMTFLATGKRVLKSDAQVEAYGTLDELVCFMGLARSIIKNKRIAAELKKIQGDLFILGAELAGYSKTRIDRKHLTIIDSLISRYEPKIGRIRCFVIPGGSLGSAAMDCARALARNLERKMVSLKKAGKLKNAIALKYINRLSDLLWILARL